MLLAKAPTEYFSDFLRSLAASKAGESLAETHVVAAFEIHGNSSRIVIDTKCEALDRAWFSVYANDAQAPLAEVNILARSETFERVLRGEVGIMMAILARKIVVTGASRGAVPRAMRLVSAFEISLPLYRAECSSP